MIQLQTDFAVYAHCEFKGDTLWKWQVYTVYHSSDTRWFKMLKVRHWEHVMDHLKHNENKGTNKFK